MPIAVKGDDSGFPKRCFILTTGGHSKDSVKISIRVCIVWLQWPTLVWRVLPGPGPDHQQPLSIAGVEPEVMRELELVDTMTWLSRRASPELAKAFEPLAAKSLAAIQKKLPKGVSLASESGE